MLKKKDREENTKIKFFSDQPISADREQDVRFGHPGIADNLRKVILNCPLPFTIGLFGRWGSGKTTILNVLRKKLQDDKVAVVNFDVWKHEGDALRRTFLKEITEQLKREKHLPKNFKLSERLEERISRTFQGRFIFNKSKITFLIGFVLAVVGFGVLFSKVWPQSLGMYLSIILSGSFVVTFLLWLLRQVLTTETITSVTDRFKDPHEFEKEFKNIVDNVSSDRLVVAIDNLDRTSHEKAVELLSTIKTFLEQRKCIFLIACDDEAIKKHLESVYYIKMQGKESAKEPFSADEFLRKFFNVSLRIPDFIDTELEAYTEDLLKETGIPQFDSPDVTYVITNAFRENPRQIKQFINILLAYFRLAQERESGQEPLIIPEGIITNNIAFLAKFLIIRQQFPSEYQQIRERHLTIKEMESIGNKEFKDFLRATKLIAAADIRPFIYLKQSEEELTIPGIRELELGLIDDNRELVKERLKVIKEKPERIDSLKKFIPSLIERNKGRRIPLFNIVSCSLEGFQYHNLELNSGFYNKIADLLNDEKALKPELQRFEPSLIFNEVLLQCTEVDRNGIVAQYVNILGEQKEGTKEPKISIDYAYSLLKELLEHKEWLKNKERGKIKQILTEVYYSSPKILFLFADSIEDQKDFISEETTSKFVSTFSNDDVENKQSISDKVELLLKFKEIITPKVTQNIVKSLESLLKNENQKPYRDEKENLLDRIEKILGVLYEQIADMPDKTPLNSFADTVTQGMNALGNLSQRKIFVFTCLKMVDILEDPWKSKINTLIQNFFSNADVDSIKFVFDKFDKGKKEELIKRYLEIFNQRILQPQPIFELLYPVSPQDIRAQWWMKLINSAPGRATQKLKEFGYKVDDKKKVVEALLVKAQGATVQEKETLYEAINEMKCANDPELKSNLASQIKSLLKNADQNLQKVGYEALQGAGHLSAPVKREIAREIIEWLRSLEPANAGQSYSIRSVILNRDILETLPSVQREYVDFVFDKLIKRGANIDNIRLGIEILSEINPKYEDYSPLFDDVLARAESEGNSQTKAELKNGLLKLKPRTLTKKNRDFWKKLEREIWVILESENKSKNVKQIEVNKIEYPHKSGKYYEKVDGNTVPTVKEKMVCRRTDFEGLNATKVIANDGITHQNRYIYFRVNQEVINENIKNLKILVDYFDEKGANWSLEYQSTDHTAQGAGDYKAIPFKEQRNDNKWHKAEFILSDAKFAKGQNEGTDFRIRAISEKDIHIHKVTVIPV